MSQERALGPHIIMSHHHGPTEPPLPITQVQQKISPVELAAHLQAGIRVDMLSACSGYLQLWPCLSAATPAFPLTTLHGDKLQGATWLHVGQWEPVSQLLPISLALLNGCQRLTWKS